jgi:uncharacterized protein
MTSDSTKSEMRSDMLSRMFLIFLLAISFVAQAQHPIQAQGGYWVHDEAGILSANTKAQLEQFIRNEEDSTSNQIAVYIVKSLEGGDIDAYAYEVFKAWKIGTADKDNGVLLLIAVEDRLMRIEVGKGLEGVLTDATSGRIRRHDINPYFQQGDYETGVKAGVLAIAQVIKGEYTNEDPRPLRTGRKRGSPWITLIIIIVFIILGSRRGGKGGRGGGLTRGAWMLPMLMGGMGRSSGGSWGGGGGGGSWGGGGMSGGGGSSGSW